MVAPTGTLPKSTAAGLELSTADEEVVEVSAAEATEVPLALVMPVQPERMSADIKSVDARESDNARGRGRAWPWIEMQPERELVGHVSITRQV